MKIKLTYSLSFAVLAFLFISSAACIIFQPDLTYLSIFWEAMLMGSVLLITLSALTKKQFNFASKTGAILALDLLFIVAVFLLIFTGTVGPKVEIRTPLGIGATFGYRLILPALVFTASIVATKDIINLFYESSSKSREALVFLAIRLTAVFSVIILGGILFIIIYKGIWALSWEFLTEAPRKLGTQGGISTAILGSLWMVLGAMIFSAPLGIGAAIYLNEYSKNLVLNRLITIAVSCVNGVPSVVFGLFGVAFLINYFGISLLSGSIVLGLINIPIVILTTQEALKSVPNSLREGSVALGATKWQTIKKVVLPSSMPGILTGLIISVAKASGETAPIMWTAVTFTAAPVRMIYGVIPNVFQPVNNLDYHLLNLIYFLGAWDVEKNAWGTALVLVALVLFTNMIAIVVRNYYRKKISW